VDDAQGRLDERLQPVSRDGGAQFRKDSLHEAEVNGARHPYGATYSAMKHAVLGFTRALRGEFRGSGVLTTLVVPGVIRTDMTGEFRTALGVRTIEPESVGNAVEAALRHGTPEIYVPREVALQGRLFTSLPGKVADQLSWLTGAARVMQ